MKICGICKEQFANHKKYSNHVRWKHKRVDSICRFCGKKTNCGKEQHEEACSLNPKNQKTCLFCGKVLKQKYNSYCGYSCCAKDRNGKIKKPRKEKSYKCIICGTIVKGKNKLKKYCKDCLQERFLKKAKKTHECICVICKNSFIHKAQYPIKTCSDTCYRLLLSKNSKANENCGGETNYKKYRYKGIYMDSSWEYDIAKWLDEKNIEWVRSRKIIFWWTDSCNFKRRYYPDFYLPKYDLYLDSKNDYLMKKDSFKLAQVVKENKITLISGRKEYILEKLLNLK